MSFYLEETCNIPFDFAYAKLAEDVIAFCLSHENFPYEAEVNLTLTDNEEIHRINLEYRQIDRPTDVLSFPMLSYETGIYNTVHKYGCSPEQILSHTFFMRKPEIFLFWKRRVKMILIRIREKSCLEILLYRSIKC